MTGKSKKKMAAQLLGRFGGAANTSKQNAARKQNAQLAGRPRRVCKFCGDRVTGGHANRSKDVTCGAHGWRWQKAHEEAPAPLLNPYDLLDQVARAFVDGVEVGQEHAELLARVRLASSQRDGVAQ